jgi:lipopolysaccharide transport system permease protein
MPAASVITRFVDFVISAVLLAGLMIWYQFVPSANIIFLPLFVIFAFIASFSVGLWVAALMVQYRDFKFIVPFVVQFGLYISPVGFQSGIVPDRFRLLYSLNPMVSVIDGFRWAILGGEHAMYWPGFVLSTGVVAILITTGIWYFRRTEKSFADVI